MIYLLLYCWFHRFVSSFGRCLYFHMASSSSLGKILEISLLTTGSNSSTLCLHTLQPRSGPSLRPAINLSSNSNKAYNRERRVTSFRELKLQIHSFLVKFSLCQRSEREKNVFWISTGWQENCGVHQYDLF